MRPGGGKAKGRSFELQIARRLGEWLGDRHCLYHTHTSGAMGSYVPGQSGDIAPQQGYVIGGWNLCIECKKREEWSFDDLIKNKDASFLYKYWKQVVKDAERSQLLPLLIVTKNRFGTYVLYDSKRLSKMAASAYRALFHKRIVTIRPDDRQTRLSIVPLDCFLTTLKPSFFGITHIRRAR